MEGEVVMVGAEVSGGRFPEMALEIGSKHELDRNEIKRSKIAGGQVANPINLKGWIPFKCEHHYNHFHREG